MQIGIFQRASLAIVLIGTMLLPLGTCLQMHQKTQHSCCAHASGMGKKVQANCCVVREQQPAVVLTPSLPNTIATAIAPLLSATNLPRTLREDSTAVSIPPLSPPTGAFNLRI